MNDIWLHIFEVNNIDASSKEIQIITGEQIKNSKESWKGKSNQFEPRLLCKMDNNNSRPSIFKNNNIYIISIKNGTYALIKENIYIPLIKSITTPIAICNNTNSLILDIGNSEMSMLDNLYYNGIISNIIGEPIKFGPLLGGRHRCSFNTIIGSLSIEIKGSQYETDGCYETDNYICIVEAKSCECVDFNIRQLYYPVREVYNKIGNKKQIIALFIYKDKNNTIYINKFKWNNYEKMLDIINLENYQYYYIKN